MGEAGTRRRQKWGAGSVLVQTLMLGACARAIAPVDPPDAGRDVAEDEALPPVTRMRRPRRLVALDTATLFVKSDGQLYWWGTTGTTVSTTPSPAPGATEIVDIERTFNARRRSGAVEYVIPYQQPIALSSIWADAAGGSAPIVMTNLTATDCAVHENGMVTCDGVNHDGQLGNGRIDDSSHEYPPTRVPGVIGAFDILTDGFAVYALVDPGSILVWGGLPGREPLLSPTPLGPWTDITKVSTEGERVCALHESGQVDCWGLIPSPDACGLMDDSPHTLVGIDAVDVASSTAAACVVRRNGHVYCWGYGDDVGVLNPPATGCGAEVPGLTNAVEVASSTGHTCVLRADEQVWCWGSNRSGQLGNGRIDQAPVAPGPVSGF